MSDGYRRDDSAPWSSLSSTSPKGVEDLTWPGKWAMGMRYGNSTGKSDDLVEHLWARTDPEPGPVLRIR